MNILEAYAHPHWPDLTQVWLAPTVVQIHLFAALGAFAVATWQVAGPKGTVPHRVLGWTWVIFMFVVAASSFFIRDIFKGWFSPIHILSIITLIALPRLVLAARRHDIKAHRREALGLYIGALIIAGAFTLAPGRLMWHVFFGPQA